MKIKFILISILILKVSLLSKNIIEPDYYTKEGYCVVTNKAQKYLGLTRFNTTQQFQNKCKGKMIFMYQEYKCRWFTMKNMNFDIYISDGKKTEFFRIGEIKEICSEKVIESI